MGTMSVTDEGTNKEQAMWLYAETEGLINSDHIEQVQPSSDPVTVAITMASGREFFLVFDSQEKRDQVMRGLTEKLGGVHILEL